jgi:hypothetical protein
VCISGRFLAGTVARASAIALSLAGSFAFALATFDGTAAVAIGGASLAAGTVAKALLIARTLALTATTAIAQTLLNFFLRAFAGTGTGALPFARHRGSGHQSGDRRHHHEFLNHFHFQTPSPMYHI